PIATEGAPGEGARRERSAERPAGWEASWLPPGGGPGRSRARRLGPIEVRRERERNVPFARRLAPPAEPDLPDDDPVRVPLKSGDQMPQRRVIAGDGKADRHFLEWNVFGRNEGIGNLVRRDSRFFADLMDVRHEQGHRVL